MLPTIKLIRTTSLVWLAVIVAVAILLTLLAVVQYRWLGEVSQAERERLQANIRTASERFIQDFDQEILRTVLTFQVESGDEPPALNTELATRYDYWLVHAPYPKVVGAIRFAERSSDGMFRLSCFKPASRDLQRCDWPAELLPWKDRIEHEEDSLPPKVREEVDRILAGILRDPTAQRHTLISTSAPLIADEVPAILIPTVPSDVLGAAPGKQPTWRGYTIVELDGDYISREFLPALAQKHFAYGNRLDFRLAVVRQANPLKALYQSDPQSPVATTSTSDAVMTMFSVRLNELRSPSVLARIKLRPGPQGQNIIVRQPSTPNSGAGPTGLSVPLIASVPSSDAGKWLLLVTHRAGSVEAAVVQLRRRNLIVSAGVLCLLVVSIVLVIILAQKVQRVARQQMVLVAGVSHELRTPVAVICSAGDNLAEGVIASSPQVRRYGDLIRREGEKLSEMVEQTLEFVRIQSKQKARYLQPIEIEDLIEEALEACGLVRSDSDYQMDRNIEMPLPSIMGDPIALRRALENLLRNAMKYSGDRRWIGIAAHAPRNRNKWLEIAIEDRGIGISKSDLPNIFEPFYRGKETVDTQIQGSGLGLSLVKFIVEAHGGMVSVKSALGHGSTFTVRLPVEENNVRQSPMD